MTKSSKNHVKTEVETSITKLSEKKLVDHAIDVNKNSNHRLSKHINKYPKIPFVITQEDLKEIEKIEAKLTAPEEIEKDNWTPLEKLLYAHLWKDGKLKSTKNIIDGIRDASQNSKDDASPKSALVYYYFGRYLTNRRIHPILDQHTVRAYKLINKHDFDSSRAYAKVEHQDAQNYIKWFREILENENIKDDNSIICLDKFLFGLGKFAKTK